MLPLRHLELCVFPRKEAIGPMEGHHALMNSALVFLRNISSLHLVAYFPSPGHFQLCLAMLTIRFVAVSY